MAGSLKEKAKYMREYRINNLEKVRAINRKAQAKRTAFLKNDTSWETYPQTVMQNVHSSAYGRGLPVNINADYILKLLEKQNYSCALTNIPFDPSRRNCKHPEGMSVDQIVAGIGYIEGNVQLVCTFINYAKNEFSQSQFKRLLKKVVAYAA